MNKLYLLMLMLCLSIGPAAAISLHSPADGALSNSLSQTFTFDANSSGACDFMIGNETQAIPINTTNVTFTLEPGYHLWTVHCPSENVTAPVRNLTIDVASPHITIINPLPQAYDASPQIQYSIEDNTPLPVQCTLALPGQYKDIIITPAQFNVSLYEQTSLPPGSYGLSFACNDGAGNSNTSGVNFSVNAPPFFEVAFSKDNYAINEPGTITVHATNKSSVAITISTPTGGTWSYNYINQTYPRTELIPSTKKAGTYGVSGTMSYKDTSLAVAKTFAVDNTIQITISGDTDILEDASTTFQASVSNAISPYTILWATNNGTSATLQKTYPDPGTFTEKVTVTDAVGNTKTAEITVKVYREYTISIKTIDGQTQQPISGALVAIAGVDELTNSSGIAAIKVRDGKRDLDIEKAGYKGISEKVDVNANKSITYELTPLDLSKPIVSLLEPKPGNPTSIPFSVAHNKPTSCSLYLRPSQESWYSVAATIDEVAQSGTFSISPSPDSYAYRIECTDGITSASSQEGAFDAGLESLQAQDTLQQIQVRYNSLGKEELEVVQALGLQKQFEQAKKQAERISRDINNLNDRNDLTSQQKSDERARLQSNLKAAIDGLPTDIQIKERKTFVKFPTAQDLLAAAQAGLGNGSFNEGLLQDLQNMITVQTNAYVVELSYPDEKKIITLIDKQITYSSEEDAQFLIELFPTDFEPLESLTFINDHQPLQGAVRIGLDDRITYYAPRELDLALVENAATVVLSRQEGLQQVSGFSIIDLAANVPLGLGIIAVLSVLVLTVAFRKRAVLIGSLPKIGGSQRNPQMDALLQQAFSQLGSSQVALAVQTYQSIASLYQNMAIEQQSLYSDNITHLCYTIDSNAVRSLLSAMQTALQEGKTDLAMQHFNQAQAIYAGLPSGFQDSVRAEYALMQHKIEEVRSIILNRLRIQDEN